MVVPIANVNETTGSSLNIRIPAYSDNNLLIAFTNCYKISTSPNPTRSAPSGGGGSWTLIKVSEINEVIDDNVPPNKVSFKLYAWRSIPTSTGDAVAINVGSSSGSDGQYSVVYSLHNAEYKTYSYHPEAMSSISVVSSTFDTQGSRLVGMAIGGLDSIIGVGPYTGSNLDETNFESETFGYLYSASYNRCHSGLNNNPRIDSGGISWGATSICTNIQVAVNSVQCALI
jgi:hypothetical protein